ncbi:MAG TPA: hypothetical protein DCF44_06780 [Chitinophagaceae bacterium]|nr:hypothetical protein [Chitinophagaceae bacterium]
MLKHFGRLVTVVSNAKNLHLVKSLIADVVIDYQIQDFTQTEQQFEFIFDAVKVPWLYANLSELTGASAFLRTRANMGSSFYWL